MLMLNKTFNIIIEQGIIGSHDIVVGKSKSMVSFKKSYFFLFKLSNQATPPGYQSYLSYNWPHKPLEITGPEYSG